MSRFDKLLLVLALVFVTGCTPRFDKLFSSSCHAPCWYGVTPGKTTKDELVRHVPTFPYYQEQETRWYDANRHYSQEVPASSTAEFWMSVGNHKAFITMLIKDDLVTSIKFSSGLDFLQQHIALGLNLGDIVEKYGKPDRMFIKEDCGGDVACRNLVVIYPDKGIMVAVESGDGYEYFRVLRTLPVVAVVYFEPPDYRGALSSLVNNQRENCYPYMLEWSGFSTVNVEDEFNGCP